MGESESKRRHREYIASPEWKARASYYKALAGNRCRVCNADDETLDAHHRTYERLGNEWDSDITVLCRTCHSLFESRRRAAGLVGDDEDSEREQFTAWARELRKERPLFYNTVLAQSLRVVVDAGLLILTFQIGHEALANQGNASAGWLSDLWLRVTGERRMVVCAVNGTLRKEAAQPDQVEVTA